MSSARSSPKPRTSSPSMRNSPSRLSHTAPTQARNSPRRSSSPNSPRSASMSKTMPSRPLTPPRTLPYDLVNLPYMTDRELHRFIDERPNLKLTQDERDYLFTRRRRMSLELGASMVSSPSGATTASPRAASSSSPLSPTSRDRDLWRDTSRTASSPSMVGGESSVSLSPSPIPIFKVMMLGDEEDTCKDEIFHLFTLPPDAQSLPPCDITRVPFYLSDSPAYADVFPNAVNSTSPSQPVTTSHQRVDIELWLPQCTRKFDSLRPLYYPATDAIIIVYSIGSRRSFDAARTRWTEEALRYTRTQRRHIPIILVGNHAELRTPSSSRSSSSASSLKAVIESKEALEFAQHADMSKYLEVVSDNESHMVEIFKQVVHEVMRSRWDANVRLHIRDHDLRAEFVKEDAVLRRHLTCADPEGTFHPFERTFSVVSNTPDVADVTFVYSVDGEPTRLSPLCDGPLRLKRPYPEGIRIMATARCKYPSRTVFFRVPPETPAPRGYFDPLSTSAASQGWGFVLIPEDSTRFYYTLDGSTPGLESPSTLGGYIRLTASRGSAGYSGPLTLRVVGLREGCLASRVAEFRSPSALPAPRCAFDPVTRVLTMDQQPTDVQYHYTVDGTDPSYSSPFYAGPVQVSGPVTCIKAIALPKLAVPSAVVVMTIGPPYPAPRSGPTVSDTASMSSGTILVQSPGSPSIYGGTVNRSFETMSISSLQEPSIPVRERKGLKTGLSQKETAISIRQKPMTRFYSEKNVMVQDLRTRSNSFNSTTSSTHSPTTTGQDNYWGSTASSDDQQLSPRSERSASVEIQPLHGHPVERAIDPRMISCKYDAVHGTVLFRFLKDVHLSAVRVASQSMESAPGSVEFVGIYADGTQTSLGKHDLGHTWNSDMISEVSVDAELRRGLRGLKCTFHATDGGASFSIKDVQIVGSLC